MKKILTTLIFGIAVLLATPNAQAQNKEEQKEIMDISQKEMLQLDKELNLDEQQKPYVSRYISAYHYSLFWAKPKGNEVLERTKAKAKVELARNMKNSLDEGQLAKYNKLKQDIISDY